MKSEFSNFGSHMIWRTPRGKLTVQPYADPNYPGFTMFLDGKQVGIFEYDSAVDKVHIGVWEQPGSEDYTAMIDILDHVTWVDCGVCGRTHEDLPVEDCRDFRVCSKCGDGYRRDHFDAHELSCDGVALSEKPNAVFAE